MQRYHLHIDGQASEPAGATWFETPNPYTGQAWAEIPRGDARDVDAAVQAAYRALTHGAWAEITPTQRGALLRKSERSSIIEIIELAPSPISIRRPVLGTEPL